MYKESIQKLIEFYQVHDWCRFDLARTAEGRGCTIKDPKAVSFCLMAATAVLDLKIYDELKAALNRVLPPKDSISGHNDQSIENKEHLIEILKQIL